MAEKGRHIVCMVEQERRITVQERPRHMVAKERHTPKERRKKRIGMRRMTVEVKSALSRVGC